MLCEPSVVAIQKGTNHVLAVGEPLLHGGLQDVAEVDLREGDVAARVSRHVGVFGELFDRHALGEPLGEQRARPGEAAGGTDAAV